MSETLCFEDPEDIDFDTAVIECATGSLLEQLLPHLRIVAKLSDFWLSSEEAHALCVALRDCAYLESAPPLLPDDLADSLLHAPSNAGLDENGRLELAGRLRTLSPPEAFVVFAGTALLWAVRARYPQAEPRDFLRVQAALE